ncbi:uncharacterized protein si:ch211-149e23.4 isoform X2 [Nothobranchius furzeri]|uniref:Transcript variant X3 n=1 Tax=Nothobranchius furzeri TaxID=105023 RepID=A0A9D3BQ71_NOTFU|nr:uncharacterized protein si:ch211-149e23.4 isoform X2 [Nothobranchius furzeri]KAF7218437.1 transcript variant X3 [Nothobranchius furzeri]
MIKRKAAIQKGSSGAGPTLAICGNITAALGEEVHLGCRYLGENQIKSAHWKRQISKGVIKRLAGFSHGRPYSRSDLSVPASPTDFTVSMNVSSVEAEGMYHCEFEEEDESFFDFMFVIVIVQPDVQVTVNAETISDTHYQSVSCSAVGGKPDPRISWLVGGRPPSDDFFTVKSRKTLHSNGTSTLSSVLRFPTHLQDQEHVTCVVQHPTLPTPRLTAARVETFTRPVVNATAEMLEKAGNDFWVVSCISSGGRPDTDISLALNVTEELQREKESDSNTQRLSIRLPAAEYEGRSVACLFKHPKFHYAESRVIALPTFYLFGETESESVELVEGERRVISLQVRGNVPRYQVTCRKENGTLPEEVQLVDRSLVFQVNQQHRGLYECDFSYRHLKTTLRFNATVLPRAPQMAAPAIRVHDEVEGGRWVMECLASGAVPAASVSWLLPEGISADFLFNSTSSNGSHSIRGVVLLPACSPQELTALCVINHPALVEPQKRSRTLPPCARPNVTLRVDTVWRGGHKYKMALCSAVGVRSAAEISWHFGNNNIGAMTETEVLSEGLVSTRSSVHFLSSLYAGQNLTCTVRHPSLETPEERTINIPVHKPPQLSVAVARQQDSPLWLAVCDLEEEGAGTNLAWVLPENASGETSLLSQSEGHVTNARLTYRFPLAALEGRDLTCVHRLGEGVTEKRTVQIPKYYISSVRVLNRTTPLQSRYGHQTNTYRVSVQQNQHNPKILLRVEGNVPEFNLDCRRSDGSAVQLDGAVMLLQSDLLGQIKGLYTCTASFYHHRASVSVQVELTSVDEQLFLVAIVCVSSASAVLLVLVVILCVCCSKRKKKTPQKQRESVSALTSLMQESGSPGVRKPGSEDSEKYAPLTCFSIVVDVKSTV